MSICKVYPHSYMHVVHLLTAVLKAVHFDSILSAARGFKVDCGFTFSVPDSWLKVGRTTRSVDFDLFHIDCPAGRSVESVSGSSRTFIRLPCWRAQAGRSVVLAQSLTERTTRTRPSGVASVSYSFIITFLQVVSPIDFTRRHSSTATMFQDESDSA